MDKILLNKIRNIFTMSILELHTENKKLSIERGFIVISESTAIIEKIPLDLIDAVLITGFGISYSHNVLLKLCNEGIPMIICGNNYQPIGILYSIVGNYKQHHIMHSQINISKPFNKNIWKTIIVNKIRNQALLLKSLNLYYNDLISLSKTVLSGDSDNKESQSAKIYFSRLFGKKFIRLRNNPDPINSFLNYGYAIIRATIVRYIIASGLNPALGVNHHNKVNPFCLVDDMIEPFRPFVDREVFYIFQNNHPPLELTSNYKKILTSIINKKLITNNGNIILKYIIENSIYSLINSYKDKKNLLTFCEINNFKE